MIAIVEKQLSNYKQIRFVNIPSEYEPLLKVMDVLGTSDNIHWKNKLPKRNQLNLIDVVWPGSFFETYSWKNNLPCWTVNGKMFRYQNINSVYKLYPSRKAFNLDDQCLELILKLWNEHCKNKLTLSKLKQIELQKIFTDILFKPDFLSTIAITEIII